MRLPEELLQWPVREVPGCTADLSILYDDEWLQDSVVYTHVFAYKSQWHIWMVFAFRQNPLQLICRQGLTCHSQRQAEAFAQILARGVGRDSRGTLKIDENVFHFSKS